MSLPDELYNVKFAEHFESIKKMYLQDGTFKNICDNYCKSVANAEIYKIKFENNLRKNQDFENLSIELEEEIRFYIIRKGL